MNRFSGRMFKSQTMTVHVDQYGGCGGIETRQRGLKRPPRRIRWAKRIGKAIFPGPSSSSGQIRYLIALSV